MFQSVRVGGRTKPEVLVLGKFKGEKLDAASAKRDTDGWIKAASERPEATGDAGVVSEVTGSSGFDRTIIVGLGDKDSFEPGVMRTVAAAVGRRLAQVKATAFEADFAGVLKGRRFDTRMAGRAFGEGLGLISWLADEFRGKATTVPDRTKLSVQTSDDAFAKGIKEGLRFAEGANLTRTLSNRPPNICTPDHMASEARKLARETGMKCTVIKGKALTDEKLVGIETVGAASEHKPCMIRLEYRPSRARKGAKPAVLVGKTITYDSGGLSIKVGGGMRGMKRDKDGGCAVLGAMHTIAAVVKPDFPVVALLACAENAISEVAYRPDDILTFRNGVTVEVTNTDAEGRLVLADALIWACEKEKPGYIVDMATLTGGVVVALGKVFAGMWCDDDELRSKIEKASEASGERVWRLPHHNDYREMMKSPVADVHNSAPVREAHPIQGAAFLSYFVTEGTPWAHIDIAGVHATDRDAGCYIAGPTGYGARLLASLIEQG